MGSLYRELCEPAPEGEPGRTLETRTKETIDNDVESFLPELLHAGRGRTIVTTTKETIDNDQETNAWLEL
jgi:hypothetical protein